MSTNNKEFNPDGRKLHRIEINRKGTIYVYEGYTVYDKEKKYAVPYRRYLGIKDPLTNEIAKKTNTITKLIPVNYDYSYGVFFLFNSYLISSGLKENLYNAFGDDANDIITLSFSIATQGSALYLTEYWQDENYNEYSKNRLTSQRISEILPKITFQKRNVFFEGWIKSIKDNEYLAYDITSISSYSKNINATEFGYNRDNESLQQINMGLLYGEESKKPAYYNIFNGSIKDVNTIEELIKALYSFNIKNCKFIMDKGFYSRVNNNYLMNNNYIFSIAVPFNNKWAKDIVKENSSISDPEYYSSTHKCYFKQVEYNQDGKQVNVHLFYDPLRKASEETELNIKVQESKQSLNKVKHRQETQGLRKYSDEEITNIIKQYGTYFNIERIIIKTIDDKGLEDKHTTINFTINKEKLLEALKYKGYLLIMTNDFSKTTEDLLTHYREKEVAENAFDDVKNLLDMNRLNIHSDEALQGKIFLVFLSLILVSYIRNTLKENSLTSKYSYKEVIKELTKIKLYTYNNGDKTMSVISSKQRKILSAFSISEEKIKAITSK